MPHARSDSPSSYSSYATSSNSSTLRRKLQTAVANQNGGKFSRRDDKEQKRTPSTTTLPQRPAAPTAAKAPQVDEIENLREMLAEKQQEMAEEKNPDRKKDLAKDLEILKQWLKDKEQKAETGKDVKGGKASGVKAQAGVAKTTKKEANDGRSAPVQKKQAEAPSQKDGKNKEVDKKSKKETKEKAKKPAAKIAKEQKPPAGDMAADDQAETKRLKKTPDVQEASTKEETAEAKSQSQLEKDRLLQNDDTISQARSEIEQTWKQQKTEACVPAVPSAVETAEPAEMATAAPKQDAPPQEFVLASEATTLMPSEKVPPCELPLWCVMPNPRDVERVLEIVRHVPGSSVPSKRMRLGRRAWALLGRRLHEAQAAEARRAGVPQPDIGLACPLSSKAHAVVLQNWTGKIFLKDLGSAHGTFLGGVRLNPHEPFEWQAGTKAFFADASTEFFELRAA
ncbi:unnamed protein product [Symbiodinium sp. CCMP2592]|nr:unnamed protein product [Symbiodinium sp. CCMP2592]